MTIEAGTTGDRRNRILIVLAMCLLFAGWFARDGFLAYPAKNLDWARQYMTGVEGLAERTDLKTNGRALLESLKQVRPGMDLAQVRAMLGEPTFENGKDYCYIGPAAFGWFLVRDGKVAEVRKVEMSAEHPERDINLQKGCAMVCGVLALATLVHLVRVLKRKTILDDGGLVVSGRRIAWDEMKNLHTQDFARKGWVDLEYAASPGATGLARLDSYAISRFDEIVSEICRRKGFASPLAGSGTSPDAGGPGGR